MKKIILIAQIYIFSLLTNVGIASVKSSSSSLSVIQTIATDTKLYVEFPILAHWYDSKRLYDYLTNNPSMMDTYPDLYTFYYAMTNTAIEQENNADTKLNELLESFAALSPTQREGQLGDAEQENEDIDYHEQQDDNESTINAIYLRLLRYGIDSLGEVEKNFITELAPQCPYIGGSAVYKARSLNYYFNPAAMYDDMKTCNAVGVYKQSSNGNSNNSIAKITIENKILSQIKPTRNIFHQQNDIELYPNPANNYIDINYNNRLDATFKIYNSQGQVLLVKKLRKENNKQRILLNNISNGLYNYIIEFDNGAKAIGKLTILN